MRYICDCINCEYFGRSAGIEIDADGTTEAITCLYHLKTKKFNNAYRCEGAPVTITTTTGMIECPKELKVSVKTFYSDKGEDMKKINKKLEKAPWVTLEEGKTKKGGVNTRPTTPGADRVRWGLYSSHPAASSSEEGQEKEI